MAFDVKQWLADLKFTAEEVTALTPQFEAKAADLEKGQLRLADYTRFAGENNQLAADLKAKDAQLTSEMSEWAALKNKDTEEASTLRTQLETTRTEAFELRERLTNLATEQGLDPDKVVPKPRGTGEPPVKDKKEPVAFDPTPLQNQIGGITSYLLTLNAELPAIVQEHYELTGERFDTRAFVAGIQDDIKKNKTDNLDPRARWEKQFEIPAKRTTKDTEKRTAELTAAETRGYEKARSEATLPGQHAPGHHAPVFTKISADGTGSKSKIERPQPGRTTRGFAESLRSGKYRTPMAGAPK